MSRGFVVALLGAESTGKTTLATELAHGFAARGVRVAVVDEVLRAFCQLHGRTPRRDEQAGIAAEQTRRIDDAAPGADLVIADTTATMIAVYSDFVFGDRSLYAEAEAAQQRCALTLLAAVDLPWQADGLQRDGPQVQQPVDTLIRASLARARVIAGNVSGTGPARLASAMASIDRAFRFARNTSS